MTYSGKSRSIIEMARLITSTIKVRTFDVSDEHDVFFYWREKAKWAKSPDPPYSEVETWPLATEEQVRDQDPKVRASIKSAEHNYKQKPF